MEYKEAIFAKFCVNLWHMFLVEICIGIAVTFCLYSLLLSSSYINLCQSVLTNILK
jgi:hypothetical protein